MEAQVKQMENVKNIVSEYERRKKEEMDFVDKEMKYLEKIHRYFKLKAEIATYQLQEFQAMQQLNAINSNHVVHQDMQPGREKTETQ